MKAIDEFRQDKSSFLISIVVCFTIWFLAVCCLFGIYIYCSFNTSSHIIQDVDGNFNSQNIGK